MFREAYIAGEEAALEKVGVAPWVNPSRRMMGLPEFEEPKGPQRTIPNVRDHEGTMRSTADNNVGLRTGIAGTIGTGLGAMAGVPDNSKMPFRKKRGALGALLGGASLAGLVGWGAAEEKQMAKNELRKWHKTDPSKRKYLPTGLVSYEGEV